MNTLDLIPYAAISLMGTDTHEGLKGIYDSLGKIAALYNAGLVSIGEATLMAKKV